MSIQGPVPASRFSTSQDRDGAAADVSLRRSHRICEGENLSQILQNRAPDYSPSVLAAAIQFTLELNQLPAPEPLPAGRTIQLPSVQDLAGIQAELEPPSRSGRLGAQSTYSLAQSGPASLPASGRGSREWSEQEVVARLRDGIEEASAGLKALAARLGITQPNAGPLDLSNAMPGGYVAMAPPQTTSSEVSQAQQIRSDEAVPADGSIRFTSPEARKRYDEYLAFLNADPVKFASQLATIEQLRRSDVQYVINVSGKLPEGAEGNLKTDGEKILINLSDVGGPGGEAFSRNSRMAHELEHARQFDDGEVAFIRRRDGVYHPYVYSIGDEVKAWKAQLATATPADLWNDDREPTLLAKFARARTDEERADVLLKNGYGGRDRSLESDVVMPEGLYQPGDLIRPTEETGYFFGRVKRVA